MRAEIFPDAYAHPEDRRLAPSARLTLCETGHVLVAEPEGVAWQIRCPSCRAWTWEDSNFCGHCGGKLQ